MRVGVGRADAVFRAADPLRAVCRFSLCLLGSLWCTRGQLGKLSVGVWVTVDSGSPAELATCPACRHTFTLWQLGDDPAGHCPLQFRMKWVQMDGWK